jgi:hypothetical protein
MAQQTLVSHIHSSGLIRTYNPSKRVDADPCPRHRSHWDRQKRLNVTFVCTLHVLFKIALKITRLRKSALNLAVKRSLQTYLQLMYETFFFPVDFNNLLRRCSQKTNVRLILLSDLSEI